jgi:hypothetical protein
LEEEIRHALFQMENNKVVGPDGIPIEFFQVCWAFIKSDITALFEDFHQGTLDIKRLNYGIITLLPKVKEAEKYSSSGPSTYGTACISGLLSASQLEWNLRLIELFIKPKILLSKGGI